ncbi:glycosyltransferase family 39 protein [Umbelopsis sp. AD052]|nr:glycosyltransferase family 39 protein [Umbelopsis sp. AD052]
MAVFEFLRKRDVQGLKATHTREEVDKMPRENDETKESGDEKEILQPTHAVHLAILAQTGTYIPFQRFYDLSATLLITALSAVVRMYRIDYPPQVVFDETHFGKFAAKYINGTFFFDVHPPLAKMLIAGASHVAGFDGAFEFTNIGDAYEGKVPHVPIRVFCATFGVLTIPIAYLTIRAAGFSKLAGLMAAIFVCFENGFVTNHRLILLDAPLLFFTATTALCWLNFQNQNHRKPFGFWWWFWQIGTGVSLGAVASIKWVGLFTIATIGLQVIEELWLMICDRTVTPMEFLKGFASRALCLITIPIALYLACFWLHFNILPRTGDGEFMMSAAFRYSLKGSALKSSYADVSYGSKLNIRQNRESGGYLHSHPLFYPVGSLQQQVTVYAHNDYHNDWIMIPQHGTEIPDPENITEPLTWVNNGDVVRLLHPATKSYLYSKNIKAPLTQSDYHLEVSTYDAFSDTNNLWRVDILRGSNDDDQSGSRLRALRTYFRLIHVNMNCALYTRDQRLPEWASFQNEVTCIRYAKKGEDTTFFIESSQDVRFTDQHLVVEYIKPSFWKNFVALNTKMYLSNEALTASHNYESRPADWPFLHRGINYWSKEKNHIYLLGNPIAYWASSIAAATFLFAKLVIAFREQRGVMCVNPTLMEFYCRSTNFFTAAWLLHWLPFFTMKRQLFLHHYMPSLYFAILIFVVAFEYSTKHLSSKYRNSVAAAIAITYLYIFWRFSAITYGFDWTNKSCNDNRLRSTWDFNCQIYP